MYETYAGLYNHNQPSPHPFGGVLIKPGGAGYADSPLRDLIDEFVDDQIGEMFNISLYEYLDLPLPYLEIIRDKKDQMKERRAKALKDIENSAGKK